jgi:hypothetical protein
MSMDAAAWAEDTLGQENTGGSRLVAVMPEAEVNGEHIRTASTWRNQWRERPVAGAIPARIHFNNGGSS